MEYGNDERKQFLHTKRFKLMQIIAYYVKSVLCCGSPVTRLEGAINGIV
jgi:hypothetical protein